MAWPPERCPENKNGQNFKKVVKHGCGEDYDDFFGDFDCRHRYGWSCDECPLNAVPPKPKKTTKPEEVKGVSLEKLRQQILHRR